MKKSTRFSVAARVAEYARRADAAEFDGSAWRTRPGVAQVTCGLCRSMKMSAKSWSRRGGLCLSCSMRGDIPRWVDTSGNAVRRWRIETGLTQEELAAMCGWGKTRQCRLEKQVRVSGSTARVIATAFARAAAAGCDVSGVVREWPLFALLADGDVVKGAIDDAEIPADLEQAP